MEVANCSLTLQDDLENDCEAEGQEFGSKSDSPGCPKLPSDEPYHQPTRVVVSQVSSSRAAVSRRRPKHPQYADYASRLNSYVGWPRLYVAQTPEELAASGFFYIGSADRVRCFQCSITLRDWDDEHEPDTEHRRHSPGCEFINQTDLDQLGVTGRGLLFSEDSCSSSNSFPTTATANLSPLPVPLQEADDLATVERFSSNSYPSGLIVSERFGSLDIEGGTSEHLFRPSNTSLLPKSRLDPDPSQTESDVYKSRESESASVEQFDRFKHETQSLPTKFNPRNVSKYSLLKAENRRLKQQAMCRLCKTRPVCILFLPCGHLLTCHACAEAVTACVLCRKTVLGTVKTFMV